MCKLESFFELLYDDTSEIFRVIDTRVETALELNATKFMHLIHGFYLIFAFFDRGEVIKVWGRLVRVLAHGENFYKVDPALEVIWDKKILCFGLTIDHVTIEVSCRQENKLCL